MLRHSLLCAFSLQNSASGRRVETYSELCRLLPEYDSITVVLIGPRMLESQHQKETRTSTLRDAETVHSGSCTTIVQVRLRILFYAAILIILFMAW